MRHKEARAIKNSGFTLVEVMVAASIMIILCVGTLSVFSYAVKLNVGNNLRSQALTVLQAEAEFYRSLRFKPGTGITDPRLNAVINYPRPRRQSMDGTWFNTTVTIRNISPEIDGPDGTTTLKEIQITTVMENPQPGWLASLQTDLTILRVRAN